MRMQRLREEGEGSTQQPPSWHKGLRDTAGHRKMTQMTSCLVLRLDWKQLGSEAVSFYLQNILLPQEEPQEWLRRHIWPFARSVMVHSIRSRSSLGVAFTSLPLVLLTGGGPSVCPYIPLDPIT